MSLDLLEPRKSALLVIDMQNAFCHPQGTLGISGVDTTHVRAVIPTVRELVLRWRAAGLPVLWTLQEHYPNDVRRLAKKLPSHTSKRKRLASVVNTWDAAIIEELADLADNPSFVIRKHRFSAFHQTRLESLLGVLGIEALFVVGVTTNACVETTIREAYLYDYDVIAVTDSIAGVNREWEGFARAVWQQYFAHLHSSADVQAWLERRSRPRTLAMHHMLLKVRDLEASRRFYCEQLGFELRPNPKPLPDGRPVVSMLQGLSLTIGGAQAPGQVDHMAFAVNDVVGLNERLKRNGVEFDRELGAGPFGRAIYVKDPDGNILELFELDPIESAPKWGMS
jgi:ureidoacrylate peracid hydrolase